MQTTNFTSAKFQKLFLHSIKDGKASNIDSDEMALFILFDESMVNFLSCTLSGDPATDDAEPLHLGTSHD